MSGILEKINKLKHQIESDKKLLETYVLEYSSTLPKLDVIYYIISSNIFGIENYITELFPEHLIKYEKILNDSTTNKTNWCIDQSYIDGYDRHTVLRIEHLIEDIKNNKIRK